MDYIKDKGILLVDDEPELLKLVHKILENEGFAKVYTASSMAEGMTVFLEKAPDMAVLDVMLPDGEGFELLKFIRGSSDIPVLFLSARGNAEDRFTGFGLGADDYIIKPFLPQELVFRITAILKRAYKNEAPTFILADATVDLDRAEIIRGEEILPLTAKEHAILQKLYDFVWEGDSYGYEKPLMAHIGRIREKIETDPSHPKSLITVKGLGYKLLVSK